MKFVINGQHLEDNKNGTQRVIKTGFWVDMSKYTGVKLKQIRKEKGVGKRRGHTNI